MEKGSIYITLQLTMLFNLNLLTAESKGLQAGPDTPHIVSGPGKIVDISGKTNSMNKKEMDDILHELWKKFGKNHDVETRVADEEKAVNVAKSTAEIASKAKKDDIIDQNTKKDTESDAKEDRKLALRELEKTIDKLIVKLSSDNRDHIETEEINKGINDITKYAELSDINLGQEGEQVTANKKEVNTNFETFKEAFFDTFNDLQKRQGVIVYHGKKELDNTKAASNMQKDAQLKKEVAQENVKKLSNPNPLADVKVDQASGQVTDSFNDFRDKFYKTFMARDEKSAKEEDISRQLVVHGKDGFKKEAETPSLQKNLGLSDNEMTNLVNLYNKLKKQTNAEKQKQTDADQERSKNIETLKNSLSFIFDTSKNRKSGQGQFHPAREAADIKTNTKVHPPGGNFALSDEETQTKRRLLTMMRSLDANLVKDIKKSDSANDVAEEDLNSLTSVKRENNDANAFLEAAKGFISKSRFNALRMK